MPQKVGSYDVYGTLGKGAFSRTRFAVERETKYTYAMKIVDREQAVAHDRMERLKNEIAIMKILKSPYCLGAFSYFLFVQFCLKSNHKM